MKNSLKEFMKGYKFVSPEETVETDELTTDKKVKKTKKKGEPVRYNGENLLYFLLQSTQRND